MAFEGVQLAAMPKRLRPAQLQAAVDAGDPPQSAEYSTDELWHAAQARWLAIWGGAALPEGKQRRKQCRGIKAVP